MEPARTAQTLTRSASEHRRAGRLQAAEMAGLEAIRLLPAEPALYYNLGNHYRYVGRLIDAERQYLKALTFDATAWDVRLNLGLVYLAQGRFSEGWPLYDERPERKTSPARSLSFPEWHGEDPVGRSFFIWPEQGFGDQIQCARFASALKSRGAKHVTLCCHPDLAEFLADSGADDIVPLSDPIHVNRHDYWVLPFSAARYLASSPEDVPPSPFNTKVAGDQIGYCWRGNPQHPNDFNRSMQSEPPFPGLDLSDLKGNFKPTAELVSTLSLLITVDTAMAHLAGSLGVKVWILLPNLGTDWRWIRGLSHTPWYPSARLFWQTTPGDWSQTTQEVRDEISRIS